jgi:hypothetical protein
MGTENRFRTDHFTDSDLAAIEVPDAGDFADWIPARVDPAPVSVSPPRPGDPF